MIIYSMAMSYSMSMKQSTSVLHSHLIYDGTDTMPMFNTKANCTLIFLRRNLQINATVMKTTAYNTLISPIVEFAPAVLDLYTVGNIRTLEKVQC